MGTVVNFLKEVARVRRERLGDFGDPDEWERFLGEQIPLAYPDATHTRDVSISWDARKQMCRMTAHGDPGNPPLHVFAPNVRDGVLELLERLGRESE